MCGACHIAQGDAGEADDRGALGYLLGLQGGYRVWIPRIGVRECRDVTFYEGTAPVLPDDGSVMGVQQERVQGANPAGPMYGPPLRPLPPPLHQISLPIP